MSSVTVNKVKTLSGHRDSVYALEVVPDAMTFFSGSGDGMVVRWELGSDEGEAIAQLGASVYALRFDPASRFLLAGHNFEGLHVLDWQARKEVGSLKLTSAAIFDIALTGTHVLVAAGDGVVSVVDLEAMRVVKQLTHSSQSARCMAIRPGSKEVAIGYSDNHIRVFSLEDYQLLQAYPAHLNSVFSLRFTPDGQWLLSGSRDARLKAWKATDGYSLHQEVAAHLFAINDICFSPDSKHFVTCSMDKSVKVWRTEDLTLLKVIDKARHAGHGTSVNKVIWSPITHQVLSASDDRTISVWDVIF
jgi:WD40 repeat protein